MTGLNHPTVRLQLATAFQMKELEDHTPDELLEAVERAWKTIDNLRRNNEGGKLSRDPEENLTTNDDETNYERPIRRSETKSDQEANGPRNKQPKKRTYPSREDW